LFFGFVGLHAFGLLFDVGSLTGALETSFSPVLRIAAGLLGLFWLERQWARLPAHLQVVKQRGITPGQAAWRNLIPVYNLYWMFAVNAALCDGVNEMLVKKHRPRTAPTALSLVCPLATLALRPLTALLTGLPLLAALIAFAATWSAYMLRVELAMAAAKRKLRAAGI
jgi:hypothetical protein